MGQSDSSSETDLDITLINTENCATGFVKRSLRYVYKDHYYSVVKKTDELMHE